MDLGISTVIYGFIGCGGLAAITYFLTSMSDKKSSINEAIHKLTQKIGIEKVDKIVELQKPIEATLRDEEKISEEIKVKIRGIQEKASTEIKEILKETNIKKIHMVIEEEWDKL